MLQSVKIVFVRPVDRPNICSIKVSKASPPPATESNKKTNLAYEHHLF